MHVGTREATWMAPYIHYLKIVSIIEGENNGWVRRIAHYTLVSDDIFRRCYSRPLLKCVTLEQTKYIIRETRKDICRYHSKRRIVTTRILRVGYFWSTMEVDCTTYVKKCIPCQKHRNLIHGRQEEIHISSPYDLL